MGTGEVGRESVEAGQEFSFVTKTGNRAPLFKREVIIMFSHCNTLVWCCTSFVNSGNPSLRQRAIGKMDPGFRRNDAKARRGTPTEQVIGRLFAFLPSAFRQWIREVAECAAFFRHTAISWTMSKIKNKTGTVLAGSGYSLQGFCDYGNSHDSKSSKTRKFALSGHAASALL